MSQSPAKIPDKIPDKLTILIFKDNLTSRTFQVSFRWIVRFGILLGAFVTAALLSVFISGRLYFSMTHQDSNSNREKTEVQALEAQLADLKNQLKIVDSKSTATSQSPTASIHRTTLLPQASEGLLPDASSLPFSVEALKILWEGHNLKVDFALQYNQNDQKTQQGRVIIMARGPDTLLTYPSGVVNHAFEESLLLPRKGEYFSVSRYREVKAELPRVQSRESLQEVEILIFGSNGEILIHRKEPIPNPSAETSSAQTPASSTQKGSP